MRKLLSIIGFLIFSTAAYAGSVNVGFTGAIMNIDVGGTETEVGTATKTNSNSEVSSGGASHNGVPIASVYLEFQGEDASWAGEGNGWAVGVKHTPGTADVSENVKTRTDASTGSDVASEADTGARNANAEIENYFNYYLEIPVHGSWYVKLGQSEIDVNTTESHTATAGTAPSNYGNATLDGINYGLGVKGVTSNNMAWKVAYEEVDYDTLKLTSGSGNTLSADLDTQELNFSLGYRF
tara:strand:+ start:1435 stop:2151 length:717 start_codon:yes stop_codon:yes gene_type:complete